MFVTQSASYLYFKHRFESSAGRKRRLLRRLSGVPHRLIALVLFSSLAFVMGACTGAATGELRGTSWELVSLAGDEVLPDTAITLALDEEALSGSAGCNHYSASYRSSGDELSVGDIAATEIACPEPGGILDQEDAYLAALSAADAFQLAGDRLELLDASGEPVLVFVTAGDAPLSEPDASPDESVVIQNATALPESNEETPAVPPATLTPPVPTATAGPPPGFKVYEDETAGLALFLPESWTAAYIVPGESAVLQSYPEDKYIGGEARDPGDTKCDLTIRPPDVDLAGHLEQVRSDPTITIVSEREILLQSGEPGIRLELESMGQSRSLVTVINERVVVLTCFGDLAPFEDVVLSVRASEER